MLNCQILFHETSHLHLGADHTHLINSWSQHKFTQAFVLPQDHYIHVFLAETDHDHVYRVSATQVISNIDPKSKTLLLSNKGNEHIILEIQTSDQILEKIDRFCHDNKNESRIWNPLTYTPCNKARESRLSFERKRSNISGLVNLVLVGFAFSKIHELINNYATHGLLPLRIAAIPTPMEGFIAVLSVTSFASLMLLLEKVSFGKTLPSQFISLLEILIVLLAFLFPAFFCFYFKPNPLIAFAYIGWNIMLMLKMISYIHVMREVREIAPKIVIHQNNGHTDKETPEHSITRENLEVIRKHGNNLSGLVNIKDLAYFYFAPTLTYQLWYPRDPAIRWGWLSKKVIELIVCWLIFLFWLNQYVAPIMESADKAFKSGSLFDLIERVIAFANAYLGCCLLFFYGFFHLFTNVTAEVLRFADRNFYKDWWNSKSLTHFWSLWNLPVHTWCTRHIYYPLLKRGYSKKFAACVVFFFSGLMHEYMCCLSLRIVTIFYSMMMFGQAPILILEKKYDKFFTRSQVGNILFWLIFWFISHPIVILFYYARYLSQHGWVSDS